MPEPIFDRSSKWLIKHHGNALLYLGGIRQVRSWKALQAEVVQPAKLPDGLLEVYFERRTEADHFLIEVATYPERRILEQALKDLTLTYQCLRQVPELLVVVLHPRGRVQVGTSHEVQSRLGWSRLSALWKVVELWTLPAEELLEAGDYGVVPWATLARSDGPPERLLERCRERIEVEAPQDEKANLLAVTQVLARLRYPQQNLLALLGGKRAMIESPLIEELMAEQAQDYVLRILRARFGHLPDEIVMRLRKISKVKRLEPLIDHAAVCADLDVFRRRLPTERANGKRRRTT